MRLLPYRRPIGSAWSPSSPGATGYPTPAAGSLSRKTAPKAVKLAKRLSRTRSVVEENCGEAGRGRLLNERGQPYNAQSVRAMLRGPQKRKRGDPKAAPLEGNPAPPAPAYEITAAPLRLWRHGHSSSQEEAQSARHPLGTSGRR